MMPASCRLTILLGRRPAWLKYSEQRGGGGCDEGAYLSTGGGGGPPSHKVPIWHLCSAVPGEGLVPSLLGLGRAGALKLVGGGHRGSVGWVGQ